MALKKKEDWSAGVPLGFARSLLQAVAVGTNGRPLTQVPEGLIERGARGSDEKVERGVLFCSSTSSANTWGTALRRPCSGGNFVQVRCWGR